MDKADEILHRLDKLEGRLTAMERELTGEPTDVTVDTTAAAKTELENAENARRQRMRGLLLSGYQLAVAIHNAQIPGLLNCAARGVIVDYETLMQEAANAREEGEN